MIHGLQIRKLLFKVFDETVEMQHLVAALFVFDEELFRLNVLSQGCSCSRPDLHGILTYLFDRN